MTDILTPALKSELLRHFDQIATMDLDQAGWAERESSDMFQSDHFSGGFDATEGEFLFSYFPDEGGEFWFGISLADVQRAIDSREVPDLKMRVAE